MCKCHYKFFDECPFKENDDDVCLMHLEETMRYYFQCLIKLRKRRVKESEV